MRSTADLSMGAEALRWIGWCEDLLAANLSPAQRSGSATPVRLLPAGHRDNASGLPFPLLTGERLPAIRQRIASALGTSGIYRAQLELIDALRTGQFEIGSAVVCDRELSPATLFWLHHYAGITAVFFNQDDRAADHLHESRRIDKTADLGAFAPTHIDRADNCFFLALAHSRPTARGMTPQHGTNHLIAARDRFEISARLDPALFQSKHLLLEAEAARLIGDATGAQALYERAADAAAKAGLTHERALAQEFAGSSYLEAGLPTPAQGCFQAAIACYQTWGADGKAAQLARRSRRSGCGDTVADGPSQPPNPDLAPLIALGSFAASIVHEINQPLAGIITHADVGLRWLDRPQPEIAEARDGLRNIGDAARRAAEIITSLRALVQQRRATLLPVCPIDLVRDALRFAAEDLDAHGVQLVTEFSGQRCPILADRIQLRQVVLNLITNAIHAMATTAPEDRRLVIRTTTSDDGFVHLAIEDSGCGMSEEVRARVFEPFFTTRSSGMGVGLALCRSIVRLHGGSIDIRTAIGQGTTFELRLPLAIGPDPSVG
ncbi:sensor histidine kinase [Rhodopseudomonas telluris]|uniref:histidine kinase n=1 Tax=Rhodopseudomonas telluris TaxID=644215 RepID=A0ABV6EVE5_9BRAD